MPVVLFGEGSKGYLVDNIKLAACFRLTLLEDECVFEVLDLIGVAS